MPLGTLDRRPPPFFHQGPSALTRLAVFSAVALFLMAADTRFAVTRPLRSAAIFMNLNGTWSQLTPFLSVGSVGTGTLHFEVEGSSLKLFWKATGATSFSLVSFTNDTTLTTGTVGMRMTQGVGATRFNASCRLVVA